MNLFIFCIKYKKIVLYFFECVSVFVNIDNFVQCFSWLFHQPSERTALGWWKGAVDTNWWFRVSAVHVPVGSVCRTTIWLTMERCQWNPFCSEMCVLGVWTVNAELKINLLTGGEMCQQWNCWCVTLPYILWLACRGTIGT